MLADTPFQPTRNISGFRTGAQGLGHAVLMVADFDKALSFNMNLLGFRISDFMRGPLNAAFLHVNTRHHSLALFEHPKRLVLHHLMMELYSLDDVGQGYDRALGAQDRVAVSLGRHHNDYMTSFYMRSPPTSSSNTAGALGTSRPTGSRSNSTRSPASGAMTG